MDENQQKAISQVEKLVASGNPISLEIGSGSRASRNGWVTIDRNSHCDIRWDLRHGIPFPDESIEIVYSSHFLEHLTYEECQVFLDESLRVLKRGGMFSVSVPNVRIYAQAYLDDSRDISDFIVFKPAFKQTHSRIDYLNYITYMDGHHKYMFDEENLVNILAQKGFDHVRLREFDPELDSPHRNYESIYAIAGKPSKLMASDSVVTDRD